MSRKNPELSDEQRKVNEMTGGVAKAASQLFAPFPPVVQVNASFLLAAALVSSHTPKPRRLEVFDKMVRDARKMVREAE